MERIAVYGAGTIGSCQATLIIGNGLPCTVIGHSERGLERCRKSIEQNWDDLIAEGLATEGNKQAAMALVTITNDPAALQEHTFVFEAVAEGTEEKRAVYETIEQNAAPNVVIASCTSSIDAEILAGLVSHPERLLIAHPFQPVHMLPLVEVVRHEKTAEDTVTRTLALLETLQKVTPVPEGVEYVPSQPELEALPIFQTFSQVCYGGMPVQIGSCNGDNHRLNALEYHRDSEFNLACTDLILLIGHQQDIDLKDYTYDTAKVEAFLVPKGTLIEVYATTQRKRPPADTGA